MKTKLAILSGGTGTPKLLQGLKEVIDPTEIAVIVNTAEDKWLPHGFFSPDIDTVLYTLSGIVNDKTWYGIKGDTFITHKKLLAQGCREILNIGDKDRAMHVIRGELMKRGKSLSQAVEIQKKILGVESRVYPMTDGKVETVIETTTGEMDLHEYLIEHRGQPKVKKVFFKGIKKATPNKETIDVLKNAEGIIIGPSNPISSILPILSLKGIKEAIKGKKSKCIAISPIVGTKPVSGPADKFMLAMGLKTDSFNVAKLYRGLIGSFVIDASDENKEIIERLGVKCYKTNTIMRTMKDKKALARFVLDIIFK